MVNPAWIPENPNCKFAESDTLKWLEGFYLRALEKGDLSLEDRVYLNELSNWIVPASRTHPQAADGAAAN